MSRKKDPDVVKNVFYLSNYGEKDYRTISADREGSTIAEKFSNLDEYIDDLCEKLVDLNLVNLGTEDKRIPMSIRLKKKTHNKLKKAVKRTGIPQINIMLAAMRAMI